MKRRIVSILTSLALCLTLLPTTALAGNCSTCIDEDGDYLCDECLEVMEHTCADIADDAEGPADHYCDLCGDYMKELCADADEDHVCDNENCSTVIPGLCSDTDDDHLCDNELCRVPLSECEDSEGNDNICDICGEGIYPKPSALNVTGEESDEMITVHWDPLEDVGTGDDADKVSCYVVYCVNEDDETDKKEVSYPLADAPFIHRFEDLTNGAAYEVGVTAIYTVPVAEGAGPHEATQSITASPYAMSLATLVVGDTSVVVDGVLQTEDGAGWEYDGRENTLTLSYADITSQFEYQERKNASLYADGDLNIVLEGGENSIAPPSMMCDPLEINTWTSSGIYVTGDLSISGTGTLEVTGGAIDGRGDHAASSGIVTDGRLWVYEATVKATGGSVTLSDGSAYSRGVYAGGDLDVDFGGKLLATGGEVSGSTSRSSGMEVWGDEDKYLNVSVYDGELIASGGEATGVTEATSIGALLQWSGLYSYEPKTKLTISSADATATGQNAKAYSNGVYAYAGDVGISGGIVSISSGSWSAPEGDGIAVYAAAHKEEHVGETEEDSWTEYSGGSLNINFDKVTINPYGPGLLGTNVTITAAQDMAICAQMGVDVDDALAITSPEGGNVSPIWAVEPAGDTWVQPDYYTITDGEGSEASAVTITMQTRNIIITGLSYTRKVVVPVGWSVNETYCDALGIDDFSEALDTEKDGFRFDGWYTDEALSADSKFTFDDAVHENTTLYPKWTELSAGVEGSSDSDDDSSDDSDTTVTERNEDGSTTTTTTDSWTGTVTETTRDTNGVTGTIVTDKKGEVTGISANVPAAAAKGSAVVTLPLEVSAAANAEDAQEIRVNVPSGGATVEVPVENMTPGTVAVLVRADGTEEVIRTSAMGKKGVVIELEEDATVKIVENAKEFTDVPASGYWAKDAIQFVTARGIFSGTSEDIFDADAFMTRGMLAVVLHSLESNPDHAFEGALADVADGAWYEEGIRWAAENKLLSGYGNGMYGPLDNLSREQLAVMLWSYARFKGVDVSVGENTNILSYDDAFDISEYAIPAMQWACGAGMINGYGNGCLGPDDGATRAQVAQMLMNFINDQNA